MHTFRVAVFFIALPAILIFGCSPGIALLTGLLIGLFLGQPFPGTTKSVEDMGLTDRAGGLDGGTRKLKFGSNTDPWNQSDRHEYATP